MKMLVLSFLTTVSLFSGWVAADSQSPVKVYGAPESPYVRKVMSVLEHKKIAYDLDPTLPATVLKALQQKVPVGLEEASPLGKIPAVKVDEGTLADSAAIAAYLEKKWPANSLYPNSPYLMGKTIWFEQYAGSEMGEIFNKIFVEKFLKPNVLRVKTDEKIVEQLMLKIPAILQYLEKSLSETKTFYLVSNELTIADIAVLHQFIGLQKAKVSIELPLYPKLKAYLERGMKHPSIQAVLNKL